MKPITYRLSLDMHDISSQKALKAKKGDSACEIRIVITELGKVYQIADGCYATFSAKKADGEFIYSDCVIEDNTIVYDFSSSIDDNNVCQLTACEGVTECEVTLYKDNEQLTSPRFTLVVDGTVYNGEEIASSSVIDAYTGLVKEIRTYHDETKELIDNSSEALASLENETNSAWEHERLLQRANKSAESTRESLNETIEEAEDAETELNNILGNTNTVIEGLNNIEAALDEIIALQEHFIGGGN